MGSRSRARRRALEVLYESEVRDADPSQLLGERITRTAQPLPEYTLDLVQGVDEHRERIDELLSEHAQGWEVDRMPLVDRNVLRIGTYELLWRDDVPDPVAVSEAVGLAREMSSEEAPRFVSGLMTRLLELKPTLLAP